ncbi:MAG TPA: hypothetical protein VMC41_04080 [Candidatus Nanoarchaeia archaeon]|nr:hypothetical protein [Candidatus Nanoarchaeia archaeon]
MRFKFWFAFLLFVVAFTCMWGCGPNPYKPAATTPTDTSAVLTVLADSGTNGQVMLYFYAADYLFDPAETKTALRGFSDWTVGVPGTLANGKWFYYLQAAPGVYKFNFWGAIHWADTSKTKESQFWFPELADFAIKITSDLQIVKPTLKEALLAGSTPSTPTTPVKIDTTNQTIVIQWNGVSGMVFDTVFVSYSKGTIVLMGDSIVYQRAPSLASLGYDTVKLLSPGVVSGAINYDCIVRWISSQAVTNRQGVSGYKVSMTFDPVTVRLVSNGHPFEIGLPNWTQSPLGAKSNGRYPFTSGFMTPGRYNFDVGGDSASSWADSSVLDKSIWGYMSSPGHYIMQAVLLPDGRWLPGSLVDTAQAKIIHDTLKLIDSLVKYDTLPGKLIIDSIKVMYDSITKEIDSIPGRPDTIILAGDLVKTVSSTAVSGGYNFSLDFSQVMVKVVPAGRPFEIGLPNWNKQGFLGSKSGMYYPYNVTLAPGTYTFGIGGDSATKVWADSSVLKGTVWGYKTSLGWILRATVTNDGRFVPTSLVTPGDTVTIKVPVAVPETVFVKLPGPKPDTIVTPGKTVIVIDTFLVRTVKTDTVIKSRDTTLYVHDTIQIIDQGTVPIMVAGITSDTSWLDPSHLTGIASLDSIYRLLRIHTVLTIGSKKDSTYDRDTARTTTIVPLAQDTFNLTFKLLSATAGTGDTFNVNFALTTKTFSDGTPQINALGVVPANWNQKTPSTGIANGSFNFSAKMVSGQKYLLNFVDNGAAWAQQSVLKLSQYVYVNGSNVDLAVALNSKATGFVYAPPAAP